MANLVVVHSATIEHAKVAGILRAFATMYERKEISLYSACEQDTRGVEMLGPLCPLLTTIRPTSEVRVTHEDLDDDRINRISEAFFRVHGNRSRRSLIRWAVSESGKDYDLKKDYELWLYLGWSLNPGEDVGRWCCGCSIGGASPGKSDKVYRRDLLRRIIDAWGLTGRLLVELDGDSLTVNSADHWKLMFTQAEFGGKNPRAFEVSGFEDFDAAFNAAKSAVRAVSKRVDSVRFSAAMVPDLYIVQREALNKVAGAWHVEVDGHLTPEAETVLQGGPIAQSLPNRVPAFFWRENQDSIMFYGDVLITPKGLCLELTSNCGDVKKLLKRARIVEGLEFHEVS